MKTDQRHESGRPKHARTEENVTTVYELVSGKPTMPGRPETNTMFNTYARYPERRV